MTADRLAMTQRLLDYARSQAGLRAPGEPVNARVAAHIAMLERRVAGLMVATHG